VRLDHALPVATRRQEQSRAQNVLLRRTEPSGSGERPRDCLARLFVRVAAFARSSSAHCDVLPDPNGAGIGGGFLEAAALPVGLPH